MFRLELDKFMAKNCRHLDLIIGGDQEFNLYSGNKVDTENIDGPYPMIVKSQNKRTLIIHVMG